MITRRSIVKNAVASTALGAVSSWNPTTTLARPNIVSSNRRRIVVGIMGLSRGLDLAKDLAKIPEVVIRYVCDPDAGRLQSGAKRVQEMGQSPQTVEDFRRILDDGEVDALICAAPNHWHGPATILACKAGKHVYVEKPCSHNPAEGEWMVQAADKYKRCVQMGTQRRSGPTIQEAIRKLHDGVIGKCYLARGNFQRTRDSIGKTQAGDPPPGLRYDLWQGPVPHRPYRSNVVHYNWHWFWHYGNGELGNNGIHCLDICRWGLQVDYPSRVVSSGGKFLFDDDQETPDTQTVAFEFSGDKQITYHSSSRNQHAAGPFVMFYGSEGSMELTMEGAYKIFDMKNKEIEQKEGAGWGQAEHLNNFIQSIRDEQPSNLNQPILEGHKSTLLCHLGNIAHRLGQSIDCNPANGRLDDRYMQDWWRREYDAAWEKEITT